MARPRKLDQLKSIDAKEEKVRPTTLEQLWGGKGTADYGTLDEKEYEKQLDNMNLADLQIHAVSKGLLPKDDSKVLKQRLLNLFKSSTLKFKAPPKPIRPNPEKVKAALEILAAGKS